MKLKHITQIGALAAILTPFSLNAQSVASVFDPATDNGDGSVTTWFGTFTPEAGDLLDEGWIAHTEHGRLYVAVVGNGLWIYDPNVDALGDDFHGWIYTTESLFPYFYVDAASPLYLIFVPGVTGPADTPRVFLTPDLGQLLLPKASVSNIVETAAGNPAFSSLVTALQTAGLVDTLAGEGPFTVFAPTDDAFGKLDPAVLNDLLTNEASLGTLTEILTYHVVPGRITADMLGLDVVSLLKAATTGGYAEALNGSDLRFDLTPFGVMINGESMVTTANLETSNGIIHVIDTVLMPPADIVDTAVGAGFSTLASALQSAGLVDTLKGDGPFTVFAPTDEAFAALPDGTLESLTTEQLVDILTYHVVAAEVYSADVAPGTVTMVNGDDATLSVDEAGNLLINEATITSTDIVTSNGVIHVIDSVILPPEG
jgi:uncharacterized surface protein with fasciclin (FAS1) repeats